MTPNVQRPVVDAPAMPKPFMHTPTKSPVSTKQWLVGALLVAGSYWLWRRWSQNNKNVQSNGEENRSLLDQFMPEYEFHDQVSTTIDATPAEIFAALRQITLSDMPVARILGELRYLPARLFKPNNPTIIGSEPFIELISQNGGNLLLAERPNQEVVLGSIGKFHSLTDQHIVPLWSKYGFLNFADPDYQKLAINLRLEEKADEPRYTLVLEHRTHALSKEARRKFALYWLLIKPGGNLVSKLLLNAVKRRAEASVDHGQPDLRHPLHRI